MTNAASQAQTATLYRMEMEGHVCPHGLKSKALLDRRGYNVTDTPLTSRAEIDAFKAEHGVATTPQTFIDGTRIGGYDDLAAHFGKASPSSDVTSYQPVIALFSVAAFLAIAITWLVLGTPLASRTLEFFIAISMVLLGLQKLQDIDRFATMFLGYDLLAQRWVRYAHIYPFIETGAGLLMLAGALTVIAAPAALFIASIGAYSVYKAVYVEKRDLKCACVGGDSRVPLGVVSLIENLMMIGMALWMLATL